MTQHGLSRRSFLRSAAVTGIALSAAPLLKGEAWADHDTWPPTTFDILFDQNALAATADLHASGMRRHGGGTSGYLSAAVPKATIVGAAPPRLDSSAGANAAGVAPIAGLFPRDEWTCSLEVHNDSGVDFVNAPFPAAQAFLIVGALMLWRFGTNKVGLTHFASGQHVEFTIAPGEWPAGTSKKFTIWWRRSDTTLWLMKGSDYAGRLIAGPPTAALPPATWPPSGKDHGVQIGGGESATQHPFDIANTKVHRYFWPVGSTDTKDPARVTVNASTVTGTWHPGLSGVLGLYEGFWLVPETPATIAIRDQQLPLVFDSAGSKHVRFGGPMQYVGITPVGNNFSYNWTNLDAKLDALLNGRPNLKLHLTLDYTPPVLQPAGGDHRSPPTNFTKWARIASDIVGHVKTRYGSKFASCTMWNEPDLTEYWTGTAAQMYSLWSTTQTRLLTYHPDKKMGNPEYAYTAGFQGFFSWLATQSTTLKQSISALYCHDFQQDLHKVRERLVALRTAANNAGVSSAVPVRITEYNLDLAQLLERHNDANSWFTTQPIHFLNEYAAAYAIHFLWEALDQENVDVASFAAIGTQALFWGEQAIVSSTSPVVPHGPWSTIALLSKLAGNRVSAVSNWPSVKAFATKEASGAITLVYANFRPYRGLLDNLTFALQWSGLPASYTWTHWQYDGDTSTNGQMAVVGTGNQTNLPASVTMRSLGVGGIRIVP